MFQSHCPYQRLHGVHRMWVAASGIHLNIGVESDDGSHLCITKVVTSPHDAYKEACDIGITAYIQAYLDVETCARECPVYAEMMLYLYNKKGADDAAPEE